MKNRIVITGMVLMVFLLSSIASYSQCSVCRASAESSVEQGYTTGRGLNKGIVYLMTIPYAIGGTALYIYLKHRKRKTTL
jgi:hypothetical protein